MRSMDPAESQKSENQSTLNNEPQPVVVRREPDRDLVTWTAPSRPFVRYPRQYYVTIFAIAGIVGLVVFLAEGIMPVILIVSLVFLYYILSTVKPENIEYKVTNKGIKIGKSEIPWQNIIKFWFLTKGESEILIMQTLSIPGKMEVVVNREIKEQLKKEISAYVPYEEILPSTLDKVTNWFSKKLPGNN
jgi:hypothetical protein